MTRSDGRRFWIHVSAATVAIMVGCWLSSGTVAPYGTYELGECHYRMNGDHGQFTAVFAMVDGAPPTQWHTSVVLRRVLHPLLAYPLMKTFGFEVGGVLFNILLHGASMLVLALALRRYFDARAAVIVCWLFASYPGYAYFGGLPYSYAMIVPGSIACGVALLWWNDRPSHARTMIAASVIGIVTMGYDLMPYFGGALLLLALFKRRWRDLPIALIVLVAWAVFIGRGLPAIWGFPVTNSNTASYGNIFGAWLHFWERTDGWGDLLLDLPRVFVSNFFFSGHVWLPALFLLVMIHHVRYRVRPLLDPVPLAIVLTMLGLWLFLNCAPPYEGRWQLRGTWLARLYQPWFVAILFVVARVLIALRDTPRYKALLGAILLASALGCVSITGPYYRIYAVYMAVHQNFYQDASLRSNYRWLHKLGVRPMGVCG